MPEDERASAIVLGAAGYVGGELLRLLIRHPGLRLRAAISRSSAGRPLSEIFPHLEGCSTARFESPDALRGLEDEAGEFALFSCLPHGEAAGPIKALLSAFEAKQRRLPVVDLSADFRLESAELWSEVYGRDHGAPEFLDRFRCALPDLDRGPAHPHMAHPGCFSTAVSLGAAPLIASSWCEPRVIADAVTGSTGSGRAPVPGTHHPERHASFKAYKPLSHRHRFEMEALLSAQAEEAVRVLFVPHSGPFARGIHATLHFRLHRDVSLDDLRQQMRSFYEGTPFVSVLDGLPRLKNVVGTNRCHLGVAVEGRDVVVTSIIDNLCKGAAGGALQWMNRILGLPESSGLDAPAVGWI